MHISATVINEGTQHQAILRTGEVETSLAIAAKSKGLGSSVNGGELLFLALATCYCNDVYREAKERGLTVDSVRVEVSGYFGGKGEPARDVTYRASVSTKATKDEVIELMRYTDSVSEVQNTLRQGTTVNLVGCEVLEA